MPLYKTNLDALNKAKPMELALEINSFAGGENLIGEDAALKANEARLIQNWDAISMGGMIRSKGFNEVADGSSSYTDAFDLLVQHIEGASSTRVYGVIGGDLVYKNGSALTLADAAAFTSGVLCHAISKGDKLWITNSTDNLQYKTLAGAIATPSDVPTNPRDRIYYHKFRLVAEGGSKTVYGSRAGTGNWTAADAWSLANDAWSIDLPDNTYGCAVGFPSGDEITVFTKYGAYSLFNFPNVAQRYILGSHGCSAPYAIAIGSEGCYFVSEYPTKGVYLWTGVDWINLTINHNFVDDIDFSKRIFGTYRDNKYYLLYNELGSGVTYSNRIKVYDAQFGRWMTRSVNASLSDSMGYPALLTYDNNELYFASAQKDKIYEFETDDDSDENLNTEAVYTTKVFTSRDFSLATGGALPIDDVRMKLLKFTIVFYGTTGSCTLYWSADDGKASGSQTIDLSAEGDLINSTFVVNTSYLVGTPPDKVVTKSFNNAAVGRRFSFQISNSGTSTRPKIKRIKISAIAIEEA